MPTRKSTHAPAAKKINRHRWLFEPLEGQPMFAERRMFGSLAAYFNGLLVLVLCDSEEPWRGVLVPTERESHPALLAEFPALAPHPILGKWLYLPESAASFERDAQKIVERIRRLDPRFGVVPERKRAKRAVSSSPRSPRGNKGGAARRSSGR
jgi:hypothetical protein